MVPLDIPLFPRNLTRDSHRHQGAAFGRLFHGQLKPFNGGIGPRDIFMSLIDRLLLELARQA